MGKERWQVLLMAHEYPLMNSGWAIAAQHNPRYLQVRIMLICELDFRIPSDSCFDLECWEKACIRTKRLKAFNTFV